jgi:hypothetical protein
MAYFYQSATQQNSNATANTDTYLMNIKTAAASMRLTVQKLQAGSYATPADNGIRLRLHRTSTLLTAGTAFTPNPMLTDAPAANATVTTLPTSGAIQANPVVQLAFNQRGTGLWAAFVADEGIGAVGTTASATTSAELVIDSQSTGTSVPINTALLHTE